MLKGKNQLTIIVVLSMITISLILIFQADDNGKLLKADSDIAVQNFTYNVEAPKVDIREIYITIFPPDKRKEEYNYTFEDLNQDVDWKDEENVEIEVLFQEGEAGGPKKGLFGYGLTDSNAIMKLRGHSVRQTEQKSYKIELNKEGGQWLGLEEININKHPFDNLKVRNKLSYDYLKRVPNLISLDTQYVQVFIKDFSNGDFYQNYEDYGLFVNVEEIDKSFLKKQGLDKKGYLYKAENFEFGRYYQELKLETDPDYNYESFETILEIKGAEEHAKLIRMLEDVNNQFKPINDTIEEHFNRDNYLTWLAVNILFGNIDTASQNYYLYSSRDNNQWHFIPWDFDGSWGYYEQSGISKAPWQEGVSNYWGNSLHRRFFQNQTNIIDLSAKIEQLAKIFSERNTRDLLDLYKPIVLEFLTKEPDFDSMWEKEELQEELKRIPTIINSNKQKYYVNIEKPMPTYMGEPLKISNYYSFKWGRAYDLQGDKITYSFAISKSPEFTELIFQQQSIQDTEIVVDNLEPGKYYWRLQIIDSKGNVQVPFDIYNSADGKRYFGVKEFFVY